MAALTASSWTLTISKKFRFPGAPRRQVEGTLKIAGTDTYPDNGIPLPAIGQFGFVKEMSFLQIFGVDPTKGTVAEYVVRYDATNHKLFLYEEESTAAGGPLLECDTSEVPGERTWNFIAQGW